MQFAYNSISYSLSFSLFLCAHQFAHSSSFVFQKTVVKFILFAFAALSLSFSISLCACFWCYFHFVFILCTSNGRLSHVSHSSPVQFFVAIAFSIRLKCSLVLRFSQLAIAPFRRLLGAATYGNFIVFNCICIAYTVHEKQHRYPDTIPKRWWQKKCVRWERHARPPIPWHCRKWWAKWYTNRIIGIPCLLHADEKWEAHWVWAQLLVLPLPSTRLPHQMPKLRIHCANAHYIYIYIYGMGCYISKINILHELRSKHKYTLWTANDIKLCCVFLAATCLSRNFVLAHFSVLPPPAPSFTASLGRKVYGIQLV